MYFAHWLAYIDVLVYKFFGDIICVSFGGACRLSAVWQFLAKAFEEGSVATGPAHLISGGALPYYFPRRTPVLSHMSCCFVSQYK